VEQQPKQLDQVHKVHKVLHQPVLHQEVEQQHKRPNVTQLVTHEPGDILEQKAAVPAAAQGLEDKVKILAAAATLTVIQKLEDMQRFLRKYLNELLQKK
jgi:hypothetical protein